MSGRPRERQRHGLGAPVARRTSRSAIALACATSACLAAPSLAAPPAGHACATLSEAEAAKLFDGPLGEVASQDKPATDDNGNDRQSSCGYFPKGYRFETADGPPARGVLVELHALRDAAAARRFYEGVLDMHTQMAGAPGNAPPTKVQGYGSAGYVQRTVLPASAVRIATVTFLKGATVASAQVWTTTGDADAIARASAKQVAARLP